MIRLSLPLLLACGLLAACSGEQESASPEVSVSSPRNGQNMDAPPLDPQDDALLETLEGEALSLGEFSGEHVLLNYWATWCAPCIEEIPALLNAARELGDEYRLLLVSDEPAQKIREFLDQHDFDGQPFIRLTRNFASHGVRAVPSTVLYGPDGSELRQWLGAKAWDSPQMLEEIAAQAP